MILQKELVDTISQWPNSLTYSSYNFLDNVVRFDSLVDFGQLGGKLLTEHCAMLSAAAMTVEMLNAWTIIDPEHVFNLVVTLQCLQTESSGENGAEKINLEFSRWIGVHLRRRIETVSDSEYPPLDEQQSTNRDKINEFLLELVI
jgi:hypothetical protein